MVLVVNSIWNRFRNTFSIPEFQIQIQSNLGFGSETHHKDEVDKFELSASYIHCLFIN
jgi:hypothetical protein